MLAKTRFIEAMIMCAHHKKIKTQNIFLPRNVQDGSKMAQNEQKRQVMHQLQKLDFKLYNGTVTFLFSKTANFFMTLIFKNPPISAPFFVKKPRFFTKIDKFLKNGEIQSCCKCACEHTLKSLDPGNFFKGVKSSYLRISELALEL